MIMQNGRARERQQKSWSRLPEQFPAKDKWNLPGFSLRVFARWA